MFTSTKLANLLLLSTFALVILASCYQVDAQFFTKSSKSIPRMGRRSDSSMAASQYKHQLLDSLIDEYGPQFVAALEGRSAGSLDQEMPAGGEVVYRNDQPFDLTRISLPTQLRLDSTAGYELLGQRDERSTSHSGNLKDSSLALRALTLNRLMQHLASGGYPWTSYDKVVALGKYRSALNADQNGLESSKQQLQQQQ